MRDLTEANECEVCPFGYMRKKDFSADEVADMRRGMN